MPARRRSDNGHWMLDFRVAGRRYRETLPAEYNDKGKREIEALERQRRQEIEAQQAGPADSWGSLAARFWSEHGSRLASRDSIPGHLNALSDVIGDHTFVRDIAADHFARGIAQWQERGRKIKTKDGKLIELPLSAKTINNRLGVAQSLWNRARDLWGIAMPHIPWKKLSLPVPDRVPAYVPPRVREAIIAKALPHVAFTCRLALATGWRRASVLGLRWEKIDWQRELMEGLGKGRAGGKVLIHPLTTEIWNILCEIGPKEEGPVITWHGKPVLDPKKGFNSARKAAGYPKVLFKDFRHSVGQEVLALTDSMAVTSAVLGHSQISVTQKHYARVQVDAVRRALEERYGHNIGHRP
jgi:integrase